MAGFFGFFDYTKEGPGVSKDGPKKAPIVVFFEILGRKFWNLVKINLMFLIFNIPAILVGGLAVLYLLPVLLGEEIFSNMIQEGQEIIFGLGIPLIVPFLCIPIITTGPAQAGMTYIMRNYAREEHSFIWSDFKEHALKNFKQSTIVSMINTVVFVIMVLDLNIYFKMNDGNLLWSAASGLLIMATLIFFMMNMYIYPMMITFDLSIKQLYKNALLFAIMKFIPNLFILIICIAIAFLPFWINPIIAYIMFVFISLSLTSFIINFHVYPKLKRYIINKIEKESKKGADTAEVEAVQSDKVFEDKNILKERKKGQKR